MPTQNSKREVVITGMGILCPIGQSPEEVWNSLENGVCGIGPITRFDPEGFRIHLAGEIRDLKTEPWFSAKDLKFSDRFMQFARLAARQALESSGLDPQQEDPARMGVIIGSGIGGIETIARCQNVLEEKGPRRVSPFFIPMSLINLAAGQVAIDSGFQGICSAPVTACAAGTSAIGEAFHRIAQGYEDVILAGGSEAGITPLSMAGFASMRALHTGADVTKASIPFDAERSGFVMGEGAGLLVLEEKEHALQRGAPILAEIAGFGASCDAHHMTAPDPTGLPAARAMEQAMEEAGVSPEEISAVCAHGTSTPLNDSTESQAILHAFRAAGKTVPVFSTKASTGHLLGASGAVESVICILALQHDAIPYTLHTQNIDPACPIHVITDQMLKTPVHWILNNSLGFGGHNCSLLFKKAEKKGDLHAAECR